MPSHNSLLPTIMLGLESTQALHRSITHGVVTRMSIHQFRFVPPYAVNAGTGHNRENLRWRDIDAFLGAIYTPQTAAQLQRRRIPAVNISNHTLDIAAPKVASDDHAVGVMAADYLMARGYRRMGFVGDPARGFSCLRQEGFTSRLAEFGLTCHMPAPPRATRPNQSRQQARWTWLADWLKQLTLPTAIFAANDYLGRHTFHACHVAELKVPDDIAILGVDNDQTECSMWGIALSSVEPAGEHIGVRAAELLLDLLHGHAPPAQPILVPPLRVVTRQTTDALAVEDPVVRAAMRTLRKDVGNPHILDRIVNDSNLCRRSLDRRFHRHLGHSLRAEVEAVRLDAVCRLLTETRLPLKQIAFRLGFHDQRRLFVNFRQRYHQSPSQYRRLHGLDGPTS